MGLFDKEVILSAVIPYEQAELAYPKLRWVVLCKPTELHYCGIPIETIAALLPVRATVDNEENEFVHLFFLMKFSCLVRKNKTAFLQNKEMKDLFQQYAEISDRVMENLKKEGFETYIAIQQYCSERSELN